MTGTRFALEVQPNIPPRLRRLEELANNLYYTWERQVRGLFTRLDPDLWDACSHNPKVFLRRISQKRLEEATQDRVFMEDFNRALSVYDTYHQEQIGSDIERLLDPQQDLVAYFCAEYGFHESLPIYSGGLGILAGDHCKAVSDLNVPFVAIGMLYRQGYFTQTVDAQGRQIAHYTPTNFADLPVAPALDNEGREIHVYVELPGRSVEVKVWLAHAGRLNLYLLDSDLPSNSDEDRSITYQLYGGDINTRIQQEMVLGIGGVRALRALGLRPTVWHINEGHSAFQILERAREYVKFGMDFRSAIELVAAGTVYTTHTPVPAGHDIFHEGLIGHYFASFIRELGMDHAEFMQLGASPGSPNSFNMTALALRGSRFHNGVSRIHGTIASSMEGYIWPQIPPKENPIGYVTNGVHVPTFLAKEWVSLFDIRFGGGWRSELRNDEFWKRIDEIPDHSFWSLRQSLKANLLEEIRDRLMRQLRRNKASEAQIERLTTHIAPDETDILILGFARRFATYKRATLLFNDPERLARLLNDPQRPVLILFAGKAHPHDIPGQHLIQIIHSYAQRPEFEGKILLLEGYDLGLGRRLVTGVDVWLNTPEYPLEASGTSGQKAGVNGVVNLSVLDGWWGEGYNSRNGWAITPHGPEFDPAYRDRQEANALMVALEKQVVPLYYKRNGHGYSEGWVKMSKASMKSTIPRFNSQRMVMDYVRDYYVPATQQHRALAANQAASARLLAAWKQRMIQSWPKVTLRQLDQALREIKSGHSLQIQVAADLASLTPEDVVMECLVGTENDQGEFTALDCHRFDATGQTETGETVFTLHFAPAHPGLQYYKIRMYPYHRLLAHPFELGRMIWI